MARYLNILQDQCERELNLVNDLLDMRSLDAGTYPLELSPIQLQDWIPNLIESFQARFQQQQQSLQISLPSELPPLVSDVSIFSRILRELLNNACKYTPEGEQIVVTAQPLLGANFPLGSVQLSVSNSGVEIPTFILHSWNGQDAHPTRKMHNSLTTLLKLRAATDSQ
jgi:signal transduction histidine kinase